MPNRRLLLAATLAALLGTVATGQVSLNDRAIDLMRRMLGPFAGLSRMTYGDLELERDIVSLWSLMSPAEFGAEGLGKLSASELRSLDRWISRFAFDLLRPVRGGCSSAIESKIDGNP